MTRVKRWRAVGYVVLAAVATFPCALAGEAHIKYVYELGASPNDGANPGNLLEWIDGSLYGAAGATNASCGSFFRIVNGGGGPLGSWDCAAGNLNPAGLTPGADGYLYGSATGLERKFTTVFRLTPGGQTTPFVRIPFADGFDFSQLVPFGEGSFFVSAMGGGPGDFCRGSIGCGTILLEPASGPVGTLVSIRGERFVQVSGVRFGGGASGTPLVINPSAMTVTVPAGAASGPLTIIAASGAGQTPGTFTVTP